MRLPCDHENFKIIFVENFSHFLQKIARLLLGPRKLFFLIGREFTTILTPSPKFQNIFKYFVPIYYYRLQNSSDVFLERFCNPGIVLAI